MMYGKRAGICGYLSSVESETFGAAGVDSKADVQRIEPKDYVPNAAQTDRIIKRIYDFSIRTRKSSALFIQRMNGLRITKMPLSR